MTRQLSDILSSGEITEYKKGGTTADEDLLTRVEVRAEVEVQVTEGITGPFYIGDPADPGNAVPTLNDVDEQVRTLLSDGTVTSILVNGEPVFTESSLEAYNDTHNVMEWAGEYVNGNTYLANQVVKDGNWLMVANKDTDDKPAPVPAGAEGSLYPDDTNLAEGIVTAAFIVYGVRFTASSTTFILGYAIKVKAGNEYKVFYTLDPENTTNTTEIAHILPTYDGWYEFNMNPTLIVQGTKLDLIVSETKPALAPTQHLANYTYSPINNFIAPLSGQITHAKTTLDKMHVHYIDADGIDQTGAGLALGTLTPGATIRAAGMEWSVTDIEDNLTYYTLTVAPAVRLTTEAVYEFAFEEQPDQALTYYIEEDYYLNVPNAKGIFAVDEMPDATHITNHQYGLNVFVQGAYVSPDWEAMSYSGSHVFNEDVFFSSRKIVKDALAKVTSPIFVINTDLGPIPTAAKIEAAIAGATLTVAKFYIHATDAVWIIFWDGTLYHYERLTVAI